MPIRITRTRPNVALPEYKTPGAVAFDLAAATDATIAPKAWALIPTGLIIAIPEGHVLFLTARSSLFKKTGLMLANGVGTIDPDYCGPEDELQISVWNTKDEPVEVKAGDRLAQGLFLKFHRDAWEEGPAEGPNRGGFGTTGHNG
jgi:dUTP pyrophosphatase